MHSRPLSALILLCALALGSAMISHGTNAFTKSFHPKVHYEVYGDGIAISTGRYKRDADFKDVAVDFVRSKLELQAYEVVYQSGFSSDIVDHVYFKQAYNNITFTNAVANVALKNSKIIAFGSSFVPTNKSSIPKPVPTIPLSSAISIAEKRLSGEYNKHPTTLEYFAKEDESLALVYVMQIRNESAGTWYQAHVDAHSGGLVSASNFVSMDSYFAVNVLEQSILDGQSIQNNPQNTIASPLGWQLPIASSPQLNFTIGNNVFARVFATEEPIPATSNRNDFKYTYEISADPTKDSNPSAAAVNAFYTMNMVHDVAYLYGFTEEAFNFQNFNFEKGGSQSDFVIVSVQDSRKTNNADFATPPDGQPGLCRMFLFTDLEVRRDSDLDNSVLIHEATHGITNRLIGGGSAVCLGIVLSHGLGEGWSDMMANWFEQTSAQTHDFVIGEYVSGEVGGIRRFPYSTNPAVNPLRFSSLNSVAEVHDIGEIWANMLHNVYALLVESYGFSNTAMTDASPRKGNVIFLHLFMDSLSLLPCEPNFFQARDAIIQADQNRYEGTNKCLLWKAFASRGLGTNAVMSDDFNFQDGEDVPDECDRDT